MIRIFKLVGDIGPISGNIKKLDQTSKIIKRHKNAEPRQGRQSIGNEEYGGNTMDLFYGGPIGSQQSQRTKLLLTGVPARLFRCHIKTHENGDSLYGTVITGRWSNVSYVS